MNGGLPRAGRSPYHDLDWCKHNSYLTDAGRYEVNKVLNELGRSAEALTASVAPGVLLVVAGSLARQEPATRLQGRALVIRSDVDFVAVTPPGMATDMPVRVIEELRPRFPELDLTVFQVEERRMRLTRGYFGADLRLALERHGPGMTSITEVPPVLLGLRERLELLTHQASNWLLRDVLAPPGLDRGRDDLRVLANKVVLEALRACAPEAAGASRLADAAAGGAVVGLRGGDVARHLEERDVGNASGLPLKAEGVLGRALQHLTGSETPLQAMVGGFKGAPLIVDAYQVLVLGLASGGAPEDLAGAARSLSCRGAGPGSGRETLSLLKECGEETPLKPADPRLLALRREYYALIGPHNFGFAEMPAYGVIL